MKTTINSLKLVFTTVLLLTLVQTKAQLVSLNLDGSAPNTNAQLDIKSTGLQGKGLLIPRMTQLQRTVILTPGGLLNALGQLHGGPAQGLIVYQTDGTQGFYYNTSTTATPSWSYLSSGGSGATGATGPTGANGSAGATGPTGAAGTAEAWLTGSAAPTGGQGSVGDWYFRTSNNEILEKTASTTWTSRATITGATGATGTAESWLTGSAAPTGGQGSVGDWYFRTSNNEILEKTASTTWTSRATIVGATGATGAAGATGPTGAAGSNGAAGATGATGASESWLTGSAAPTGGQGSVGDWYFRTSNNEILEKTASTTWTSRATIVGATGATGAAGANGSAGATGATGPTGAAGSNGAAGATGATGASESWLTGSAAPTGGQGAVGDWYFRTSNNEILEKTASTTWTSRATIVGATGATGAAGAAGATGASSAWYSGNGNVGNGQYDVGDWYLRTSNGDVFEKTGNLEWTLRMNIMGPTGPTGSGGSGSGWGLTGNSSTNPSTNFIGTTDNKDFVVRTNGNERMRVLSDGKIGIGTTTPAKALDVVLNSSGTNVMNIRNTNAAGYSSIDYFDHNGNQMCNVGYSNSSAGAYAGTMYFATNTTVDMTWGGNNVEHMRMTHDGKFGIGTSSPSANLHVDGTFRLVDGTQGAGKVLTSDANGNATWSTPSTSASNIYTSTSMTLSGTSNNNLDISNAAYVKLNNGSSSNYTITGIAGGTDGEMVVLQNVGTGNMTIKHNATSSNSNRILTNTGSDVSTSGTGTVTLMYDGTQSRWIVISVLQ